MAKDSIEFCLTLGIYDIPKVLLVALSTFVDLGWKVWFDLLPLRELDVKLFDRYLWVMAHIDPLYISFEK